MNGEFYTELQRRASEIDCYVDYDPETHGRVHVYFQGKPLGVILYNTLVTNPNFAQPPERDKVYFKMQELIHEVLEYVTAHQKGICPPYEKFPNGYHSLVNYNDVFLASTKMEHGGYQFVTWQLGKQMDFEIGRYTTDYKIAKRDFAQRSGLVHRNELFSPRELQTIQIAIRHTLDNENISCDLSTPLQEVYLKVFDILQEQETSPHRKNEFEQTF
jgi:hypothetical protein